MPYIHQEARHTLNVRTDRPIASQGELNYAISQLIRNYTKGVITYALINDVLGALEGAKLEFYRTQAVPYEDEKRKTNGEVYL